MGGGAVLVVLRLGVGVVLEQQADRLPRHGQVAPRGDLGHDPVGGDPAPRADRIDPEFDRGLRHAASLALATPAGTRDPPVAWADVSQRFYIETLGCPKNQVDSDKLIGTLLADGMTATDDPGAADLVVVNTCAFIDEARRESIETILAPRRPASRRGASRRHRMHGRALRRGARRSAARSRPGRRVRRPVNTTAHDERSGPQADPGCRGAAARARPAQPAAAPVDVAVGVRQDRRRLRPLVRVLRDPVVPRTAAQPRRRVDPARGRRARGARDRARRPGPGVVRQGPPGRARGGLDRAARQGGRRAHRLGAAAVPLSERSHRRADRRDLRERGAVLRPLAPAREQAAAASHATLGRRQPLPRADRRHPGAAARRRLPLELHRRLPGRDGGRSRPAAALRRGGAARLVRLLRLLTRGRHVRGDARSPGRPGADERAARRAPRAAGRDHRRTARRDDRARAAGARRRPGVARSAGEAPEIDGIVHVGHDVPVGEFVTVEIADALGPDLVAVGATAGESDGDGR